MNRNPENRPGGKRAGEFLIPARIAALAIALASFGGLESNASAEPPKFQNQLIQTADEQLTVLADELRNLGIRPERIKYYSKTEKNASRYEISKPVLEANGELTYTQLVVTIKDGQRVPAEVTILHRASHRQYNEDEKFDDGVITSRDVNANMYWMERVNNSSKTAVSKGIFPLVNLPLEKQDKSLGKTYGQFLQEAASLINYIAEAGL